MAQVTSYDDVAYAGYPFPQTHPGRLATLATLLGMHPASIDSCRVLELGCGDGANLIPMAVTLPGSHFVGIDLAQSAIAKGQAVVDALGLPNITLEQRDILGVTDNIGLYDYIIVHGVYSWVPPVVQDKIISICKTSLADQGVAYVSYNTYPGGHLRQMLREMMLFHVRHVDQAIERVHQARALVRFLSESQPESGVYAEFLKEQLDLLTARADGALYHDDLAPVNTPVYFYQFVEHAARHGLQYLTEANLAETQTAAFGNGVTERFRRDGINVIAREQYLDFLKCRKFRQTLLCHDTVAIDRSFNPERFRSLYVTSSARPLSPDVDCVATKSVEGFRTANGGELAVDHPLAKAVMRHLGEIWPKAERFDRLLAQARLRIGANELKQPEANQQRETLAEFLVATYGSGLVELHPRPPAAVIVPGERPVVSPLARLQALQGLIVTTLRHTIIEIKDDLARHLLILLDGTRDRSALVRELTAVGLQQSDAGNDVTSGTIQPRAPEITVEQLETKLSELAQLGLLIA